MILKTKRIYKVCDSEDESICKQVPDTIVDYRCYVKDIKEYQNFDDIEYFENKEPKTTVTLYGSNSSVIVLEGIKTIDELMLNYLISSQYYANIPFLTRNTNKN